VIADASDESPDQQENKESSKNENEDMNAEGDFEFTSREEEMSTQVLGKVMEEEAKLLNQEQEEESKSSHHQENKKNANQDPETMKRKASKDDKSLSKRSIEMTEEEEHDLSNIDDAEAKDDDDENDVEMEDDSTQSDQDELVDNNDTTDNLESKVITDLDQLKVREFDEENDFNPTCLVEEEIHHGGITHEQLEQARRKWSDLQSETVGLSRRLCEKLRLVMEPLVASKLRGDYRTGKRINMKRVIGYIASGYRKDKIWLRRTKPGKRDYRVLLAVDNSESMKNGAGDMALTAMATLANGMSQLEIGELGIASFGEEMKLLHPFNAPFTSSSGIDLVSNFTFADKRTRTALCVESALAALEAQTNSSSSMQLVFIISDGRIERDSRERLRRVVREMTEKNILLIMVVVEGDSNQGTKVKDSIVNMKEVSFENGKPKVKHFIDDYPFPYYMVLQDMHTLPEVLGDALKQWFEMMAHYQKPR
jgi:midasin